jgi:hypothetical protein
MYGSATLSVAAKGPLFLPIHPTVVYRNIDSDNIAYNKRFGLVKLHHTDLEDNTNLKECHAHNFNDLLKWPQCGVEVKYVWICNCVHCHFW